ncbi:hypothetical protein FRC01_012368, partial [Tulasnella sp. 417]
MFALPSAGGGGGEQDDIPRIPVQEDAATLQVLLQMIYPIDPPPITSFPLAHKLVTACDKYFVSTSKLRLHLRNAFNDDKFIKEDRLACYALSWKLGWAEEAIKASRHTHTFRLTESSIAKRLIEQSGDIEALLQLLRLKDSREEALDDLLSLVKDNSQYYVCNARGHPALTVRLNDYAKRRTGLKQELNKAYPNPQNVEAFLGFQLIQSYSCDTCGDGREARLQAFRSRIIAALEAFPQAIPGSMSSQTTPSTNTIVKAPFDASSVGDCFLRSSDGANFKASRVILSIASPFFRDMFALPQPGDETSNTTSELPVIPVEEDAQTLETFLTMLYPLDPPVIQSYEVATKLVRACDKYLISPLRLKACLRDMLATPEALKRDPLGVYALAWRLGLEEEAKTASRYTHRMNLRHPQVKQDLITRSGGVEALLALWDMRLQREEQLDRIANAVNLGGEMGCSSSTGYAPHSRNS